MELPDSKIFHDPLFEISPHMAKFIINISLLKLFEMLLREK